jgi:hypothetical protein
VHPTGENVTVLVYFGARSGSGNQATTNRTFVFKDGFDGYIAAEANQYIWNVQVKSAAGTGTCTCNVLITG